MTHLKNNLQDVHIHLEKGSYTAEWVEQFVREAVSKGIQEIWLLEHCYLFPEFVPMYDDLRRCSGFIDKWLRRKAGRRNLTEYLRLTEEIRGRIYPVKIRFGLEICYLEGKENFLFRQTESLGLDFLVGSIHFAGAFAFDHVPELWQGQDVDSIYRQYFRHAFSLADSGLFDGMAHPDSIGLFGHTPSYPLTGFYDILAGKLAARHMYAEQYSGVYRRCPDTAHFGMQPELLSAMKKHGVPLLTASDAHCPEDVGDGIRKLAETL